MQNAFSKTASLFLSASVLYIAHGETLYWTGKDSAAPTTWSDTAANWTNSAGVASAWINGSSAEFAPSSSLSLSVEGAVEVRNFQLMRQQQITLGGSGAIVFVADGEAATNTLRTANGQNLFFEVPVTNNVAPLKKTGFGIVYFRSQQSEFKKSFILAENQARINGDRSLGPGDVVLTGSTSLFCEQGTSADVEAKFVQSRGTYIGTLSHADKLTLRNIGIVAGDFSRTFGFGRTGSGESAATLSLTNAASEGIGTYAMRGNFKLTLDGGLVKVAPEAGEALFKAANEYWPRTLYLSENGVTFDLDGVETELGATLFAAETGTKVASATAYANNGFEDDAAGSASAGWTIDKTANNGVDSFVTENGSAFTKDKQGVDQSDYYTQDGSKFLVLRGNHVATHSFFLPEAGCWRVSFWRGCRPHDDYPSHNLALTVTIDGKANLATHWPEESSIYTFRNDKTAAFLLPAGEHTVTFKVGSFTVNPSQAVFLDAIAFEREEDASGRRVIAKTGAGALTVTNLPASATALVADGTLKIRAAEISDAEIVAYPGAAIALAGSRLASASISVSPNATLRVLSGKGENLVTNGSFEDNAATFAGTTSYLAMNPGGWTMQYNGTSTDATRNSGLQRDGGAITASGPNSPFGMMTAYMRESTSLSQTITVPADGDYRVSFIQASRIRSGVSSYEIPLVLSIDGKAVISNAARIATYDYFESATNVTLTAGAHTLQFDTGAHARIDAMLLIDNVRVESLKAENDLQEATVALEPGSTLVLDNTSPLIMPSGSVTVGGVAVRRGTRETLAKKGVNVEGEGEIVIGTPTGLTVIIR